MEEIEQEEPCSICHIRPVHGYVVGTGEFLTHTCLFCHRRKRGDNFVETGSTKRQQTTPTVRSLDGR